MRLKKKGWVKHCQQNVLDFLPWCRISSYFSSNFIFCCRLHCFQRGQEVKRSPRFEVHHPVWQTTSVPGQAHWGIFACNEGNIIHWNVVTGLFYIKLIKSAIFLIEVEDLLVEGDCLSYYIFYSALHIGSWWAITLAYLSVSWFVLSGPLFALVHSLVCIAASE